MKRTRITLIGKSLLAVGILAYLVHVVDFRQIVATAADAEVGWIALAAMLLPLNLFIEGTLWRRITSLVMKPDRRRTVFGALLSGYALGFFTPGRLGELAGRSFYHDHANKWELSALVMFQRMIDMLVGVAIGLAALLMFMLVRSPVPTAWWLLIALAGIATVPALGFVLLRPEPAHRVLAQWIHRPSVIEPLSFLRRVQPQHVGPYLGLSTLRYGVFVTQFVLLIFAFDEAANILSTYTGAAMTFYGKYLIPSVTVMDLGVREGSAVFFMGAAGFSKAAAFNASLFMFVINLVLPSAGGIPFVMRLKLSRKTQALSPARA